MWLVVHSGLILACLFIVKQEVNLLVETNSFIGLSINGLVSAFSWIIPLIFAGVGVNVISEAVLAIEE